MLRKPEAESRRPHAFAVASLGCLGLLLTVALVFFALPFAHLRGRVVTGTLRTAAPGSPPDRLRPGLHCYPTQLNGQPADVWVLRLGQWYWGIHVPQKYPG